MPNYEAVRPALKTGDIVLFSGKGAFSGAIRLLSGGKWSHVGMVLRAPELLDNAVLLWESTTLNNVADVETQAAMKGVSIVPLSQRVHQYNGDVSLRHLSKSITKPMMTRLAELRKELSRRPYERSELELIRAVYDGLFGESRHEDLSSLFCSELVAEAYQSMGLLPEYPDGLPSNEYVPLDFSEHRGLQLIGDYELGPEIHIR